MIAPIGKEKGTAVKQPGEKLLIVPKPLGNGVYHFKVVRNGCAWRPNHIQEWHDSLTQFIKENPELRITAVCDGDRSGGYGAPTSYLVITEPRE